MPFGNDPVPASNPYPRTTRLVFIPASKAETAYARLFPASLPRARLKEATCKSAAQQCPVTHDTHNPKSESSDISDPISTFDVWEQASTLCSGLPLVQATNGEGCVDFSDDQAACDPLVIADKHISDADVCFQLTDTSLVACRSGHSEPGPASILPCTAASFGSVLVSPTPESSPRHIVPVHTSDNKAATAERAALNGSSSGRSSFCRPSKRLAWSPFYEPGLSKSVFPGVQSHSPEVSSTDDAKDQSPRPKPLLHDPDSTPHSRLFSGPHFHNLDDTEQKQISSNSAILPISPAHAAPRALSSNIASSGQKPVSSQSRSSTASHKPLKPLASFLDRFSRIVCSAGQSHKRIRVMNQSMVPSSSNRTSSRRRRPISSYARSQAQPSSDRPGTSASHFFNVRSVTDRPDEDDLSFLSPCPQRSHNTSHFPDLYFSNILADDQPYKVVL
ncbi:hypothetical protein FISHEDRAFT_62168 [Fistulina hepatica ATCC 64428]|nr:hypothetical protein FISHEDRAFT_62168 [Fistulina hepatica ATCC 64428]